jgi:Common central domain of tyrosinase/Polyphenol oxidase middle domain
MKQTTSPIASFAVVLLGVIGCFFAPGCHYGSGSAVSKADTIVPVKSGKLYVRKNASTPAAAADLAALATAMKAMRAAPCGSVTSWYYQAAIHSVPSSVANGNPYCPSYLTTANLKPAWMNCTHDAMHPELHFLLWHRLFIWYFEKIVRKLSGKADFALPYWDYTNTAYRVMPAPFRDSSSALFEPARLPALNQGQAIGAEMNSSLDMTSNDKLTDYVDFNENIDNAPHGAMHEYIGGAVDGYSTFNVIYQENNFPGLMAEVPSAAFDPIFWVHHANIDFLWWRWELSANSHPPVLADLQATPTAYVFFDENGNQVTLTVEQAYNQAFHMDYTYDGFQGPVRPRPFGLVSLQIDTLATTKLNLPIPIRLEKIPLPIPLVRKAQALKAFDRTKSKLVLTVSIAFTKEPKGVYEVYLNSATADSSHLVGIMTFFGAAHMQPAGKPLTKTFRFEIGSQLDPAAFSGKLTLLVLPKGQARDSIGISQVSLVSKSAAPR